MAKASPLRHEANVENVRKLNVRVKFQSLMSFNRIYLRFSTDHACERCWAREGDGERFQQLNRIKHRSECGSWVYWTCQLYFSPVFVANSHSRIVRRCLAYTRFSGWRLTNNVNWSSCEVIIVDMQNKEPCSCLCQVMRESVVRTTYEQRCSLSALETSTRQLLFICLNSRRWKSLKLFSDSGRRRVIVV